MRRVSVVVLSVLLMLALASGAALAERPAGKGQGCDGCEPKQQGKPENPNGSEVRPPRWRRTKGLTLVRKARAGSASIPPLKRSRVKVSATSLATMELRGTIRAATAVSSASRWVPVAPRLERKNDVIP